MQGLTGTLHGDLGSHGGLKQQLYCHTKNGYEMQRPPEDVYEDPEGLKLVSFGAHKEQGR